MSLALKESEQLLFQKFSNTDSLNKLPLVFILGSPRTGSTLVYQLMVNFFNFFYFSNFINNYFYEFPIVGATLELQLNPRTSVNYKSKYGKTEGLFEPSEASWVFKNWFGDKHPSQLCSSTVLPEKEAHLTVTFNGISHLSGMPILTKNAWNCFRIQELTRLFPNIHFIWLRRDIAVSALSDLEARRRRGSPDIWNSATTANYQSIQKLPYWEQVVEQQYEYNKSIGEDLRRFSRGQYLEIWYEDVCEHPKEELAKVDEYFQLWSLPIQLENRPLPLLSRSKGPDGLDDDYEKIRQYILHNYDRFEQYIY